MNRKQQLLVWAGVLLALVAGCDDGSEESPKSSYDIIAERARTYLDGLDAEPVIEASALRELLNDADEANDPVLISVRDPEHFAIGHVPGAVNAPWRRVTEEDLWSLLPEDPSTPVVVYCYSGHMGQAVTTIYGMMGYKVQNMVYGMMGWTLDDEALGKPRFSAESERQYPLETEANEATATYSNDLPVAEQDPDQILLQAFAAMTSEEDYPKPVITADALFENREDGDDDNNQFVVSLRDPDQYAVGHIPGAINIPWQELADESNLALLPPDRTIVVYDGRGSMGLMAAVVLRALGYDAWALKWGMNGWTTDPAARSAASYLDGPQNDFELEN